MSFDHDQAAAFFQRERELAARGVKRGREPKPAAQTPVARRTDELDRRLLETLVAHQGPGGIFPAVPRLARLLGVHVSTVQRSLRRLEAAGLVESVPVYETENDLEWKRRDHRISHPKRQTSNSYRLRPGSPPRRELRPGSPPRRELRPGPGRSTSEGPAGQTPVARDSLLPLEGKEPAGGGYQGVDEGARALEPVEFPVEPPASLQLADDPSYPEIVAALEQGFGAVQVEQVYPNQLTGSLAAFHKAADQLDRSACWGNGDRCQPGYRCRRHTRRKPS